MLCQLSYSHRRLSIIATPRTLEPQPAIAESDLKDQHDATNRHQPENHLARDTQASELFRKKRRFHRVQHNQPDVQIEDGEGSPPHGLILAEGDAEGKRGKKGSSISERDFYRRPTPTYSNPRARKRPESSRFFVSTITGVLSRCLMRSKSSARNSGQPVPTTSASEPSAAA